MRPKSIAGRAVIHEFKVLHHEWECDGWAWLTDDGSFWGTDHGSLVKLSREDVVGFMSAPLEALEGVRVALGLQAPHGRKTRA